MLKGFKNAAELDFTIDENKVKMEEAFQLVEKEKGSVFPLIINGERIETEKKITSLSPATKEVLGYACSCSQELAEKAIQGANEAFKKWSVTPLEERARALRKLARLVEENRYYIDAWNVEESGKNWGEADGELCEKAGIPAGVVNYIPGSGSDIGDFIVEHPLTRFINFTGSKEIGCRINEHAAKISKGQKWIKRVVAEMGGKNAIIVDSSANIKKAAQGIASSAFTFQGQKCSACSRAIVMSDVYDELVDAVVEEAKKLKADQGAGRDNAAIGPVINQNAYNNITSYIEVGRKEGTIVYGGTYSDEKGYFVDPTVIRDIKRDARIANEEIFGPVLAVIKVDSFDEALDIANQTEYGLTGSVYSETRENIMKAKVQFNVGNLYFNRKSTAAVVLQHPFGGFNMSGTDAKTGTSDYLTNFLNLKSITEDLTD